MSRAGIMLCYPFEERRLKQWELPWLVQPKYDGERCRALITGKDVILLSSEMNHITSVPHIEKALSELGVPDGVELELDGELYCHGLPFEEIHSRVSRKVNIHEDYEAIDYHLFDMVSSQTQVKRLEHIINILASPKVGPHGLGIGPLVLAPVNVATSLDDIMHYMDYYSTIGYEGFIVRHPHAPYVRKRSTYMMKFKPRKMDIYEIVGSVEEVSIHGERKGTLGALICRSSKDSTDFFNVGSGFNAEQRRELWKDREWLPGKFVEVKYQHTTTGRGVPRFPVYSQIVEQPY